MDPTWFGELSGSLPCNLKTIAENKAINQQLCRKMKKALCCLHDAGHVHGDVTCYIFVGQKVAAFSWWTWRDVDIL